MNIVYTISATHNTYPIDNSRFFHNCCIVSLDSRGMVVPCCGKDPIGILWNDDGMVLQHDNLDLHTDNFEPVFYTKGISLFCSPDGRFTSVRHSADCEIVGSVVEMTRNHLRLIWYQPTQNQMSSAPLVGHSNGSVCVRCGDVNPYAIPNQSDGTFICWGCRY